MSLYTDGTPDYEEIKGTRLRTIDHSLSSKLFSPLHDFILRRTPTWLSPSVFTLASLLVSIGYFIVAARHGSFADSFYPPWVCTTNALVIFFLWLSTTLDERQVRRTGRSSPLSEFLRNGVVGPLALSFTLIWTASALRVPFDDQFLHVFWVASVTYFLSLWATYLTGRFEHFYVGVREVLLIAVATNASIAYSGYQPDCDCAFWFYRLSLIALTVSSVASIVRGTKASLALEAVEIIAGFFLAFPVVWIVFTSYLWTSASAQQSPVAFSLLLTVLFVYVDSRLVFARICQFASDIFYFLLAPITVVAFLPDFYTKFGYTEEKTFVFSYLSVSVFFLLHFVLSVVYLYLSNCDGQLFKVDPIKRQRQPKQEPEPVNKMFEEDPEDEEYNPESEGEDDEAGIEPEEDQLDEEELKEETEQQ